MTKICIWFESMVLHAYISYFYTDKNFQVFKLREEDVKIFEN